MLSLRRLPRLARWVRQPSSSSSSSSSARRPPVVLPSFRAEVARAEGVSSFGARLDPPSTRKQVMFCIGGSLVAFVVAAGLTHAETEYWNNKLVAVTTLFKLRPPTTEAMRRAEYMALAGYLQARLRALKDTTAAWPTTLRSIYVSTYVALAQTYLDASEGRRLCWHVGALNAAVYLLWKVPRLAPLMARAFTHDPLSGRSYTLLTSVFSHKNLVHLLLNNVAMASFGSAAATFFFTQQLESGVPPEATDRWHLLAFLVSAGLFSGLVSHAVATKVLFPRLVARMSAEASIRASPAASAIAGAPAVAAPREILPSLGASGAVYAAVTLTALAFPDSEMRLVLPIFPPMPVAAGVGGILLLDVVGVLRRWRLFDHHAHLGGAAFGAAYYYYGMGWWNAVKSTTVGVAMQ